MKNNKKILVVEDDIILVKYYEAALTDYDTKVCITGEDFIMTYSDKFDLFIIDLGLPKKNGYEVLEFLDSVKNTKPVYIISAYNLDYSRVPISQNIIYASKPVRNQEFITTINELICVK